MTDSSRSLACRECGTVPEDGKLWLHGICGVCLRVNHELEEALAFHSPSDHPKLRAIFGQIRLPMEEEG